VFELLFVNTCMVAFRGSIHTRLSRVLCILFVVKLEHVFWCLKVNLWDCLYYEDIVSSL